MAFAIEYPAAVAQFDSYSALPMLLQPRTIQSKDVVL
ncbi:hypothetical protein A2U01_0115304 [Trifolium medium]|uniref:Uncharacterized protein n=1 Tax=Trifolium medium TaxID=97028 RepID=A0A392W0Q3_9FABA|nr:hypothetical protein [Trifolium medium]